MSEVKKKKKLTKIEYNYAKSLFDLVVEKYSEMKELETQLGVFLGFTDTNYLGCISDSIYENNPNFKKAMEAEDIEF